MVPQLFQLLNAGDTTQIREHIERNPLDLRLVYNGMGVYSYAALKNMECLEAVHNGFLNSKYYYKKRNIQYPYYIQGESGYTVLHFAVEHNLERQLGYMISDVEMNVNVRDDVDNTPLHLACILDKPNMVKRLINSGDVKVNWQNVRFQTPLYIAALSKSVESVRVLLRAGAHLQYYHYVYKTKVLLNIPEKVAAYGTTEMQNYFRRYTRSEKNKQSAKHKRSKFIMRVKHLKSKYDRLCTQLDSKDVNGLERLSKQLRINTDGLSKQDVCDRVASKILLSQRSPGVSSI
jgi:hypothetical protein